MDRAYLELTLEVFNDADRDRLEALLRSFGFEPLRMQSGFLLSSDVKSLQKLLPTLTESATEDVQVPPQLRFAVRSIHVFKPRQLH